MKKFLLLLLSGILFSPVTSNAQCSINAGSDQTICRNAVVPLHATVSGGASLNWTTSGTGTFSNPSSATAIYTPSDADSTSGSITLTATVTDGACVATDETIITILASNPFFAGPDQNSCGLVPIPLHANILNTSSITWSTSGSGTFSDPTDPAAVYTPSQAEVTAGTITLTASTTNGVCTTTDQLMILLVQSTVSAGFDITVCPDTSVNLSNATAQNATTLLWTTSGSGIFSNPSSLQTEYSQSSADKDAGSVTLTLTSISNGGCSASDGLTLTIFNNGEIIQAGPEQPLVPGPITLTGTTSNVPSAVWTSNGSGTFSNPGSLTTTYTPSTSDINNGVVRIQLTSTTTGVCPSTADVLLLIAPSGLSLSGTVLAAATALDKGVVLLFQQKTSGVYFIHSDTLVTADAGMFSFSNLQAGNYFLYAMPITGSSALNTYLPTYSGGTQTWQTAEAVNIFQNFSYTISLTPYTSADPDWNTGTDSIFGYINITSRAAANARMTTIGAPAAYVTVYLTDASGNKIAYTQTDVDGKYAFGNVHAGSYHMQPELVGTALPGSSNSVLLVVDGLASTVEDGSMALEERTSATTGIVSVKSFHLATYPNPTSNSISFDLNGKNTIGTLKLFNQTGTIQLQNEIDLSQPTTTIQIDTLPAGIYLLQITTANEVYTSKVIKY